MPSKRDALLQKIQNAKQATNICITKINKRTAIFSASISKLGRDHGYKTSKDY